jgi:hypothetical protein
MKPSARSFRSWSIFFVGALGCGAASAPVAPVADAGASNRFHESPPSAPAPVFDAQPAIDATPPAMSDDDAGDAEAPPPPTDAKAGSEDGYPDTPRGRLIAYLKSIQGKQTLAGIDNKNSADPSSATRQLQSMTGKKAAFWGGDFGFGSGAVNNRGTATAEAIAQFKAGLVVQFQYHACIPTRDELCGWDDIGGNAPQHLSDQQFSDLVTPGTTLNLAWTARLDRLAVFFQQMKDAGVAPLFRPFHEINQCIFWWACHKGPNGSPGLYRLTHDYLVKTKGLDNIVWVWNVQDFPTLASDVVDYDPGSAYYDVVALDIYSNGYARANYDIMVGAAGPKPLAIGECQYIPSLAQLAQEPQWTYFMLWPDFINDARNTAAYRDVLYAPNVLTADEMPGWQ